MAVKYRCLYDDILGKNFQVNISSPAHTGSSTNITLGSNPCVIESEANTDDIDSQFIAQKCKIELFNNTAGQFSEFYVDEYTDYTVEVYRGTARLFFGYIIPDDYKEEFYGGRYVTSIVFVDPVYLLKSIKYEDINGLGLADVETLSSIVYTLFGAVYSSPKVYENVGVYEENQDNTINDSMLQQTYVNMSAFHGMDGYDIIKEIAKRFCAIVWFNFDNTYGDSGFWMISLPSFVNTSLTVRIWSSATAVASTISVPVSVTPAGIVGQTNSNINGFKKGGTVSYKNGYGKIVLKQDYQRIDDDNDIIDQPDPLIVSTRNNTSWLNSWETYGTPFFRGVSDVITYSGNTLYVLGGKPFYVIRHTEDGISNFDSNSYMRFSRRLIIDDSQRIRVIGKTHVFTLFTLDLVGTGPLNIMIWVFLYTDIGVYYLQSNGSWTTTPTQYSISTERAGTFDSYTLYDFDIDITSNLFPSAINGEYGSINVRVYGASGVDYNPVPDDDVPSYNHFALIEDLQLIISDTKLSLKSLELEVDTLRDYSSVKEIEFKIGDMPNASGTPLIYKGGLYLDVNQIQLTGIWDVVGETEEESLNLAIGEEYAALLVDSRRLISADFIGSKFNFWQSIRYAWPYGSALKYYKPIQSSYDTKKAMTKVDCVEILT